MIQKPRIFIAIQYLEIGGAERSLLGLLNAIDYSRCEVDLFLYRHTGEFMNFIPKKVNLVPEIRKYTTLTRPMKDIVQEGYVDIAIARLWAHWRARRFQKRAGAKESHAIFAYVADYCTPLLPSLKHLGEYDLAISFLTPHNIVRDKVQARQKWAWIHTDYSFIQVDVADELPVWSTYERIVSISESVSRSFLSCFPSLEGKLLLMENILSEKFVREQAKKDDECLPLPQGGIRLCTVGRYSYPKAIDRAVWICHALVQRGVDVRWYIVGYGSDEALIRQAIHEAHMEERFILVGKRTNPYPLIQACDVYVQPSRYEGKAVTVREAQILGKPTVITRFPTADSQLEDGVDGIIVPNDVEGAAESIAAFLHNEKKQNEIIRNLQNRHYGKEEEVEKIYRAIGT